MSDTLSVHYQRDPTNGMLALVIHIPYQTHSYVLSLNSFEWCTGWLFQPRTVQWDTLTAWEQAMVAQLLLQVEQGDVPYEGLPGLQSWP